MMRKLKYKLNRLRWIKALFSPFTPFKVKWYVGKTTVGTPYFLPRKWVKATRELAFKGVLREIKHQEEFNKRNPEYARPIKPFKELFEDQMRYKHAVPLKFGFSMCSLGWKTKWNEYDFRHEYDPVISFVCFGYQIAVTFYHEHSCHYWESWLCYEYASDKKQSKRERIAFCRKKCPQQWAKYEGDNKIVTDYYDLILKPKYLK